jgi:hypothetical protein
MLLGKDQAHAAPTGQRPLGKIMAVSRDRPADRKDGIFWMARTIYQFQRNRKFMPIGAYKASRSINSMGGNVRRAGVLTRWPGPPELTLRECLTIGKNRSVQWEVKRRRRRNHSNACGTQTSVLPIHREPRYASAPSSLNTVSNLAASFPPNSTKDW